MTSIDKKRVRAFEALESILRNTGETELLNMEHRKYRQSCKRIKDGTANFSREKKMAESAKQRALNKKLPYNITYKDITIPKKCPVLGASLKSARKVVSDFSPSLDRIKPELGYTKGNIQVISKKANTMKSNATPEELHRFADWVKANVPLEVYDG